jgi:predicted RNase H-like HicB family nuclease
MNTNKFSIETEQETDSRWIAEIQELSGALVYGETKAQAVAKVEALALRILADRLDHGDLLPELNLLFAA